MATSTFGSTSLFFNEAGGNVAVLMNASIEGELTFSSTTSGTVQLKGITDPTNDQDAATKLYVDNVAVGLFWKEPARVGSVADIDIDTELENGDVVDGIVLTTGDRVLLKNQTNSIENGVYVVQNSGTAPRSDDFETGDDVDGAAIFVTEGTDNANVGFVQTSSPAIVGTNPITFVQFNGASNIIAGDGLTKTGNTLSVNVDSSTIVISSDILEVPDGGITNAKLQNNDISFANGTTGTDINWDSSPVSLGGTATLNVPDASETARGVVSTGTQTITGEKTFNDNITLETANLNTQGYIVNDTTITSETSNATYTITEMLGGLITHDPNGSNVNGTTDTAANIVAGVHDAIVGTSFSFTVQNTADADEIITLVGGTDVTLDTTAPSDAFEIEQNQSRTFLVRITDVTPASESAIVYSVGIAGTVAQSGGSAVGNAGDIQLTDGSGNFIASTTSQFNYVDGTSSTLEVGVETGDFTLQGVGATTINTNGTSISIIAGEGDGTASGGNMTLSSGISTGGSIGFSNLFLEGGDNNSSGIVSLLSGEVTDGTTAIGTVTIGAGSYRTSVGGTIPSSIGDVTLVGGSVLGVTAAPGVTTTGVVNIRSGEALGAVVPFDGNTGDVNIGSGELTNIPNGSTGDINISTSNSGTTTGDAGDIKITCGSAPGSTSGNGGNIFLEAGTSSNGTAGSLTFTAGESATTNTAFTFESQDGTDLVTILAGEQASTSPTTGTVRISGGLGVEDQLTAQSISVEDPTNSFYTTIDTGATTNWSFVLPTTAGTAGQYLASNAGGTMTWENISGLVATEDAVTAESVNVITIASPGVTIGGLSPSVGDTVLLLAQGGDTITPNNDNGLWEYQGSAVAMTRTVSGFTVGIDVYNHFTFVNGGNEAGKSYIQTSDPGVVDTDALVYSTFSGATPAAGNNNEIQINASNTFGTASTAYSETTFSYVGNTADSSLQVGNSSTATGASTFTIEGQASETASGFAGSSIAVTGGTGDGTANGGNINITSGNGGSTDTSAGGDISIIGGSSNATNGDGGSLLISAGQQTGSGTAGTVTLRAGESGTTNTAFTFESQDGTDLVNVLAGTEASTTVNTGTVRIVGGVGATGQVTGETLGINNGGNYTTIDTQATTNWTFSLPINAGADNQVLQNTSTPGLVEWVDPSSFVEAAGVDTDIQFNISDDLAAATLSTFQFVDSATVPQMNVGVIDGTFTLQGIDGGEAQVGSNIVIAAGNGPGGAGNGDGGDIAINAGNVIGTGGGTSGNIIISGGDNSGSLEAGSVTIKGGAPNTGNGGGITLNATTGTVDGQITLTQNGNNYLWPVNTSSTSDGGIMYISNVTGNDITMSVTEPDLDGTRASIGMSSTTMNFADSSTLNFGSSDDFVFQHNGTSSSISNSTGVLSITQTASANLEIVGSAANNIVLSTGDDANTSSVLIENNSGNPVITGYGNQEVTAHGDTTIQGDIITDTVVTTSVVGNATYDVTEMLGGLIQHDPQASSVTGTVDTAANLVAGIHDVQVNSSFDFIVQNIADADEDIVLTANTGVTLDTEVSSDAFTIGQDESVVFRVVFTNVTSTTEAATIYAVGIGGVTGTSSLALAGVSGDIQYNGGSNLAAATLSTYNFTDDGSTPQLNVGVEDGNFDIVGIDATTTNSSGSGIRLTAGDGDGSGNGGEIRIQSGTNGIGDYEGALIRMFGGVSGFGSFVFIRAGISYGNNAEVPGLIINGGQFIANSNGDVPSAVNDVTITGGTIASDGVNAPGITTSGRLDLTSGDIITSGLAFDSDTGPVRISSGTYTAGSIPNCNTGDIDIETGVPGVVTGNSGSINITTADASGSTSGDSGDIKLEVGTSTSGNAGNIIFRAGETVTNEAFFFRDGSGSSLVTILAASQNPTDETEGTLRVVSGGLGVADEGYAINWNSVSDIRYKTDITDIEDPLSRLCKIKGYEYNWKDHPEKKRQIGVIAQQLEKVGFENLVTDGKNKKSVNYNGLQPIIIEAIKELSLQKDKEIKELRNEIKELKRIINK